MKKLLLSCLTASVATVAMAAQNPLWIRNTAISPDGEKIAFTYRGDVFTVPTKGGKALQITSNKAYDSRPVWSPDSKQIVFTSNREGSDDIYIVNSNGGTATRLTTHSGAETPLAFINDSLLIFSSTPRPAAEVAVPPFLPQTYVINTKAKSPRPEPYLATAMSAASYHPSGKLIYQDKKGYENAFRKHERSSATADIWLYENGNFKKMTDFIGHDLNPVWASDGNSYYYLSEQDGTLNVYRRNISNGQETQLTKFTEHPVRNLSAADNGTLAFSWDGELYTLSANGQTTKLNIEITTDDYDSDLVKNIRTSGASTLAVSSSGDEVAFVLRGDVYVTSTKYKTTKRITNTSGQERCVSFSPDGRTLVYDSDRNGKWQLFTSKIKSPDEKQFAYCTDITEELLYSSDNSAQQPSFSPDGKYVAFLEGRTTLRVLNIDTKKTTTALSGEYNYSYADGDIEFQWSPDSKWFLTSYIGKGGWNNSDIALVSRDGNIIVDLTESGYSDGNPYWVLDGKAIVYSTGKYGMKNHGSWGNQSDVILMALDGEAWDNFNMSEEEAALKEKEEKDKKKEAEEKEKGKKEKSKNKKDNKKNKNKEKTVEAAISASQFDLANRRYRTRRLTGRSSSLGDYFLSPKGDKFYYVSAATEGGSELYVRDLKKNETKTLAKGVSGGLIADKKGENLFVISYRGISKVNLADGKVTPVEFEAFYDRKPSLEREYIYDHMLTQVNEKFYDVNMHGVDWKKYGEHYRKFLPHINNNRDFAEMMSEILGELNASHTGASTYSGQAPLSTAELGAVFDFGHKGNGLKISEILPRGPLSAKSAGIKSGDVILAIDGDTIDMNADYYTMLEGKTGRKVKLTVESTDGKTKEVFVKPISGGTQRNLMYQRWVEHNEHIVDSLSNGRIGYVHVEGMDNGSFRTVYDRLLGHYRNCDAVVVDTRYNGGGWLHNDLAILLNGKEYVRYTPRGQYIGSDPFSQWTKPSVMLVNESNYSDAHGTPYVYQTLGIGDVVGAPVPGTMTAVWWENQIDPTIVFGIPQVTSIGVNGKPLENCQLNPNVTIYNNPGDLINGNDAQLEGAVKHLLNTLDKK